MNFYKFLYKQVIYPLYHFIKNDGILDAERQAFFLSEKTPQQLAEYQSEKLTALLRFSFKHVPFYREALSRIGIKKTSDINSNILSALPLMTKSMFTENFAQLISENLENNALHANSTSGSSGQPFKFNSDARSMTKLAAAVIRSNAWAGFERGDKEVILWGAQIDASGLASIRGRLHGWLTRRMFLSSYSMSNNDLDHYVQLIDRYKPDVMVSYPGPLYILAKHYADNSYPIPPLKCIITSAEMLFDYQRDYIQKIFKTKIYNRYGSREFGCIAHEDKFHNGLRVNSDRVFIEILRADGSACESGEVGELYITDLDNYGMPLIRYGIGDRAAWAKDQLYYSSMPFPLITEIEGRSLDVVVAPNGNRIGGTFWTILLRSRGNFLLFQVVQRELTELCIKYQAEHALSEVDADYFKEKIIEKCGSSMNILFQRVDSFPVSANGKHRIIHSLLATNSSST